MKKQKHFLVRLVTNPLWDIVPLVFLVGGIAGETFAGIGAVIWFFTVIVRFSFTE